MALRFWMDDFNRVCVAGDWPKNDQDAIRASIVKWELIRDWIKEFVGEGYVVNAGGTETCALCNLHYGSFENGYCVDCPVRAKTGQVWCRGTGAAVFEDLDSSDFDETDEFDYARIEAAEEEISFLKSLLVKHEQPAE